MNRSAALLALLAGLMLLPLVGGGVSRANQGLIVRDQSMGADRGLAVGPGLDSGNIHADYLIESNMGTARGENLFHSFDQFSIGQGEVATFNNLSGSAGDPNRAATAFNRIITRVTGASVSQIDGLMRSRVAKANGSGADLILLNSNGVVFSQSGSIDVTSVLGSFSVSTADGLGFSDGEFQTTDVDAPWGASACCTGSPTAYLFSGADPATAGDPAEIRIDTLLGPARFNFGVPEGEQVSAVGGTITVGEGRIVLTGGAIRFAATGHAATRVPIDLAPDSAWHAALGDEAVIRLGASSRLTTSNLLLPGGGGNIVLRGGRLELEAAEVSAGGPDGGGIDLGFTGDIALTSFRFGSFIFPSRIIDRSSGPLADGIRLEAGTLSLDDFGQIVATAGGIVVRSPGAVRVENGSSIQTVTRFGAFGPTLDAGDIHLNAGSLDLLAGGQIASLTGSVSGSSDAQAAGNIHIVVEDAFRIAGGLRIPDPQTGGILIQRPGVLARALDNATPEARGGDIEVNAGSLEMSQSALISASSRNAAAAGKIEIHAETSIRLTGGVQVAGEELTEISSRGVDGGAGDLLLDAPRIEVLDGAAISATSQRTGNAGNVTVIADHLRVSGRSTPGPGVGSPQPSAIYAEAPQIVGSAGNLELVLQEGLEVSNGGVISVRTRGLGSAGAIDVRVERGSIEMTGGGLLLSESTSSLPGAGSAGSLLLFAAEDIRISDGSRLSATANVVDAGDIRLEAGGELILVDGLLTTRSGSALGGNINLDAGSLVNLVRSAVETDVGGLGNGGNIRLGQGGAQIPNPPRFAVLNSSRLTATAEKNQGGFISISAGQYLESPGSRVDASSGDPEKNGIVELSAPELEVSGNLEVLPSTYLDVSVVLQGHCAERRNDEGSSLTLADRPNIGPEPGGYLPASVLVSDFPAASSVSASASSPAPGKPRTVPLPLTTQLAAFDPGCRKPGGTFGSLEH